MKSPKPIVSVNCFPREAISSGGGPIPRTSREGSILPVGIGSTGSRGVRTSHGIAKEDGRRTSLAERQLYQDVNKSSPSDDSRTPPIKLPIDKKRKHTGGVPKPNGALDCLSNSHLVQNSGAKSSWRRGRYSAGRRGASCHDSRGDVPSALRWRSGDYT